MKQTMNMAIVGLGNVGRAFAELFEQRRDLLLAQRGAPARVVGVSDRTGFLSSPDGLDMPAICRRKAAGESLSAMGAAMGSGPTDISEMIAAFARAGANVLVETLPGGLQTQGEPAISIAAAALRHGMHVVTANKAVLLFGLRRLESLAAENGAQLGHSGATCAALPTLSFARRELAGARITGLRGILNGTTNYVLTRMNEDGLDFNAALAEAQTKGIAEPDPRYDIEGRDSAAKLTILANALLHAEARLDDVQRTGIDAIPETLRDQARQSGGAIKLIARASLNNGVVELRVEPEIVPPTDSLFAVRGSNKAVEFTTDLYGTLLVAGGASSRQAVAATILKDVLAVTDSLQVMRN
ncbi:MAG: homoserine dehydrogenase [Blastocatellia bacterium]